MYNPQDPPLVLNVLTSWQPAAQPVTSPHAEQRWNLAQIQMGDHPNRRRTCYHCASDPACPSIILNPIDGNKFFLLSTAHTPKHKYSCKPYTSKAAEILNKVKKVVIMST